MIHVRVICTLSFFLKEKIIKVQGDQPEIFFRSLESRKICSKNRWKGGNRDGAIVD